jgi:3-hydroxybutyryl-CoA dehydrogenase
LKPKKSALRSHLEIKKISVLGAGKIGHGVAQICSQFGFDVSLYDHKPENVQWGLERIEKCVRASDERGAITRAESADWLSRVTGTSKLGEAVEGAGLVIEAITENMNIKKDLFRSVVPFCNRATVLASGTSTLSITEIASVTNHPERFIGMHFGNPVQLAKPLEIVRGVWTSDRTFELVWDLAIRLGKTPIVVKDSPGFVSTRLGLALFQEASKLLDEGVASLKDIDTSAKLFYGHKMGPFETCDLVGLDARLNNLNSLCQSTGDLKWKPPTLLKHLVAASFLGEKPRSKGGYYTYFGAKKD